MILVIVSFWFMFVFPYKGELELDNLNFVQDKLKANFIDNHVAFVYEEFRAFAIFLHKES